LLIKLDRTLEGFSASRTKATAGHPCARSRFRGNVGERSHTSRDIVIRMRRLLSWLRKRSVAAERDRRAIQLAVERFSAIRRNEVTGAAVIDRDAHEVIVRVMYMAGYIPPHRAWYAVPDDGGEVRELSRDEAGDTAVWR
jgi:hypothetical protein